MARTPRKDWAHCWHHVTNRGIAKRTMFERREDFRFFLAHLGRAVHRGEIQVHGYCLMSTHYHLLLKSMHGELGKSMHRIQLGYSRWFNRSRRRDGTLVRSRFFSRPVQSLNYRHALLSYIDFNPCRQGLAPYPAAYPYGSASHYARPSGPPWLHRDWVEGMVLAKSQKRHYNPSAYGTAFPQLPPGMAKIIEARLLSPKKTDNLDNLVKASSGAVRAWMVRKAKLADGTDPDLPVISFSCLKQLVEAKKDYPLKIGTCHGGLDAWPVLLAGLGRELCGASLAFLAITLGVSYSTVSRLCRYHKQEMQRGGNYADLSGQLVHKALEEWRSW